MMQKCIVSAYYKIPSKQPHSFYKEQLRRWFRAVHIPVIFFTTPDVQAEIEGFGVPLGHVQFVHLPFEELNAWKIWGRAFWEKQGAIDPEKYHTPEVAAIWYEKKEFVKRAMALSNATIFAWCDAGCVRNDASEHAMRSFGTRDLQLPAGKLILQKINESPKKQFYTYPDSCIAGAIQIGDRDAWVLHSSAYDSMIRKYNDASVCCNMDQYVLLSSADASPHLYELHIPPQNLYIDRWFFMLQCF